LDESINYISKRPKEIDVHEIEEHTMELGGSGNFRRTREENEDCNMAENDLKIGGSRFGRTIGDVFRHSWRLDPVEKWIWVPKPMVLGAEEYPTWPDEIKRYGWRARKLTRVHPPPPLTQTFADRVRLGEMNRGDDERGGPKRILAEDRQGGRGFPDDSGWRHQGDELRREQQLRDRVLRGEGELSSEGPGTLGEMGRMITCGRMSRGE
jgi:hypothetical protein